ncbi:kinase [bacterium]|nr:MAG: kinase [bacterium]
MIITRTPFRISFFGGGTDYPVWYKENGGAVLSTTIDKYCYVSTRYLPPFFDHKYRIRYTKREEAKTLEEIEHPKIRECLKFLKLEDGIEMVHTSDIPAMSGIGSSSAFTVGFLHSLYALLGKMVSKRKLALDAIHIEQNILKENIGSQDQVAAAFGGVNQIEFNKNHDVSVHPVAVKPGRLEDLQNRLMLFFTGFSRTASDITSEQIKNTPFKYDELKRMHDMVYEAAEILSGENKSLDDFGRLLHETWVLKRGLSSKISSSPIDEIYQAGLESGALGGKLLGAGGGGFMLFYAEPEMQPKIREKLKNLVYTPFRFENLGSQVIFYNPESDFK